MQAVNPPPEFNLDGKQVHIWQVSTQQADALVGHLHAILSEQERERAARFKFAEHQRRYVVAHAALRQVLASYLPIDPLSLVFREGAQGKPELVVGQTQRPLQFNLSHSHEAAMIAVTLARAIGVDIEYIKPNVDWAGIIENFFAPGEIAALKSLPAELQRTAFFACWTRKESYIKARGGGLSIPLREFEVSVDPVAPAALLKCENGAGDESRWTMADLDVGSDFRATVCVEAPLDSLTFLNWSFEQVLRPNA